MNIALLPTSVSAGPAGRAQYLTTFLVDGTVAIDAGGLGFLGSVDDQVRIRDIFLSHSHMDHIASLPVFFDTIFGLPPEPVTIHALPETIDCLRRDVFNDRVWPDFITMSEKGTPFLRLSPLTPGLPVEAGGLRLTPIPVDHVVPTTGFLIEGKDVAVGIPSDTGPTEAFWEAAAALPHLKAVFLEASFPDNMKWLADVSKHLTPTQFAGEARKLGRPAEFIAVHIKPRFYDQVAAELAALEIPDVTVEVGHPGKTYVF